MNRSMKPRIQSIRHAHYNYKCFRIIRGDWVGFGKTPEEAWQQWYSQNIAPDKFNLAS